MSELKATPGPWFACSTRVRLNGHTGLAKYQDGRWVINPVDDYERLPLAEVDCGDDQCPETRKQAEHDAHLIAAAPELYEAAEAALKAIERLADEHGAIPDYLDDLTSWLDGVLSKARGEES